MKSMLMCAILMATTSFAFGQGKNSTNKKQDTTITVKVGDETFTLRKNNSYGATKRRTPQKKDTSVVQGKYASSSVGDSSKATKQPATPVVSVGGSQNFPVIVTGSVTGNVTVNVTIFKDSAIATKSTQTTKPAPALSAEPESTNVIRYPNYRSIYEAWKENLKVEKAHAFSYTEYSPEDSKKTKLKRLKHAVFSRRGGFRLAEYLVTEAEDSLSTEIPNIINTKKLFGGYGYITIKWNEHKEKWIMNFIYGCYSSSATAYDVRLFRKEKGRAADIADENGEEKIDE